MPSHRGTAPTTLERLVAGSSLFTLGLRYFVHAGLTLGDLLAVVLAAVWIGSLRRYSFARSFFGLRAKLPLQRFY